MIDAVNDSQVWSDYLTGATAFPPENAFDGALNTYAQGGTGTTLTFTPPVPIPYTDSVRVHTQYTGDVKLNPGTASEVVADAAGVIQWTTVVSGSSGTITQITGTGVNNPTWDAIEVDGELLIDKGNRELGDSNVEYPTYGGKAKVISTDATNRQLLLKNVGTKDNRWIIGATDEDNNPGNTGETGDASNAKNFYIKPKNAIPIHYMAWGITKITSNKLEVTGIQKDEPTGLAQLTLVLKTTVKFPATFATGNAPDTDLLTGLLSQFGLKQRTVKAQMTKKVMS